MCSIKRTEVLQGVYELEQICRVRRCIQAWIQQMPQEPVSHVRRGNLRSSQSSPDRMWLHSLVYARHLKSWDCMRVFRKTGKNWRTIELRSELQGTLIFEKQRMRKPQDTENDHPERQESRVIAKYTIEITEINEEKMYCLVQRCLNNVISSSLCKLHLSLVT